MRARFSGRAHFNDGDLRGVNLCGANLINAQLDGAQLIRTDLRGATLTGSSVHGASVWNIKVNKRTKQQDLLVTAPGEPDVTIDNIEVAQFIYLLLNNKAIRIRPTAR